MKSVRVNFIYNVIYQFLLIVLPLVTAPYISRTLGAEGLGIYSYTYSVAYYFLLFAMLGISNYGNRSIAATRDDKKKMSSVFREIYTIQTMTFIVAIVAYFGYIFVANVDNKLIALLQIIYVCSGLLDISWFFFGMEEFKLTVTRNIIIKVSTVFLIFLLIKSPSDVWKYTLIMSVGYLISQLYLWFYVKKYLVKTELAFSKILEHVKPILVMFIPVAAYSFYKVMDKIMLGSMCSYEQVGFFQNAEKIINIPMGIITAMGTVMLPKMSNMVSTGEQSKVNGYIELSIKVVTVIGSAIAFGLIGVSEVFTPVFFGNGFEACSALIQLLSITVFFMAWANVTRTQYLIPMKKDKIYIVSATTGAVVNLIFNLILIPRMAAIGAAIGTVLAEFSVMVVQIMMINKEITVAKYIAKSTPYLIIGVIMLIVVNAIGENGKIGILTLTMQITIGGIIYVTLAFGYLHVTKDEMLGLFKIKSKKQK